MAGVRLFTALWPPGPVRQAFSTLASGWQWPAGVKLVEPSRFHATLHFLGVVEVDRVALLPPLLDAAFEPVTLRPDAARQAVWPGGIAVLELDAPAVLRDWHGRMSRSLAEAGFSVEERAWRPHVTFARHASQARPAPARELPAWRVDAIALVRSTPGRGYETLAHYGARRGGNAHGG